MLGYRNLTVRDRALDLADRVLDLVETPAIARRFWLRDQISDAVCSVSSNIAEGNGRSTPLDYASFLDRARGSLFEVDNWLCIAERKGWLGRAEVEPLEARIDELSAKLFSMASRLRRKAALESRTGRSTLER